MSEAIYFIESEWNFLSARFIGNEILSTYYKNKSINMILTGGRSASKIYNILRQDGLFDNIISATVLLSDERNVASSSAHSNHRLIMDALFGNNLPNAIRFPFVSEFMEKKSIVEYEKLIPLIPDFIMLSLGDDGHIASIFNGATMKIGPYNSWALVESPYFPFERYTITNSLISRARKVIVLVEGKVKVDVFNKIKSGLICSPANELIHQKNVVWLLSIA